MFCNRKVMTDVFSYGITFRSRKSSNNRESLTNIVTWSCIGSGSSPQGLGIALQYWWYTLRQFKVIAVIYMKEKLIEYIIASVMLFFTFLSPLSKNKDTNWPWMSKTGKLVSTLSCDYLLKRTLYSNFPQNEDFSTSLPKGGEWDHSERD